MQQEAKDTEQHIKDTAKYVFFVKGHLNAKMQEIADEAGVNRALLHYYFRNREKLLLEVLKDAMDEGEPFVVKLIGSDINFESKIEQLVSHIMDRTIKYPYLDAFIASELVKKPDEELEKLKRKKNKELEKQFYLEAKQYIEKNNLPHLKPEHLFVNMMALCSYPSIMKPLLMKTFSMNDEQYSSFINERKTVISKILLGKK